MNTVCLMGRLVATPELKSTTNGTSVTTFTIAINKPKESHNGESADFIDCVAWRGSAEFITKYFKKGAMIAVTGRIQTRTYEDRDGNKRKATEVVVNQADSCGSKSSTSDAGAATNTAAAPTAGNDFEEILGDDNLPF